MRKWKKWFNLDSVIWWEKRLESEWWCMMSGEGMLCEMWCDACMMDVHDDDDERYGDVHWKQVLKTLTWKQHLRVKRIM